ncbi:hypothetical protein STRTUCAR8_00246, partial [Streptomyces turgidiscabies Car8]
SHDGPSTARTRWDGASSVRVTARPPLLNPWAHRVLGSAYPNSPDSTRRAANPWTGPQARRRQRDSLSS